MDTCRIRSFTRWCFLGANSSVSKRLEFTTESRSYVTFGAVTAVLGVVTSSEVSRPDLHLGALGGVVVASPGVPVHAVSFMIFFFLLGKLAHLSPGKRGGAHTHPDLEGLPAHCKLLSWWQSWLDQTSWCRWPSYLAQAVFKWHCFNAQTVHFCDLLFKEVLQLIHGQDTIPIKIHTAKPILDARVNGEWRASEAQGVVTIQAELGTRYKSIQTRAKVRRGKY